MFLIRNYIIHSFLKDAWKGVDSDNEHGQSVDRSL